MVVRAMPEDAEAILALQRLAFQAMAERTRRPSLPPLTENHHALLLDFESSFVAKALWAGQLVGSGRACASKGICDIRRMSVHPDFRGKGVGAALLRHIEESFPEVARFELFTSTENIEAIRLYQRHGYAITHTEYAEASGPLVYMAKPRDADT